MLFGCPFLFVSWSIRPHRCKRVFLLAAFSFCFFSCNRQAENQTVAVATEDCRTYQTHIKRLEKILLEAERNADRFENVMYNLTQNYMVIDQKVRLIQKYQTDPTKKKLLKRTASEINLFFIESHRLLDSVEYDIQKSMLPQSSVLPMIDNIRDYLNHQEKLFVEVYGSIYIIRNQVEMLRKSIQDKEIELAHRTNKSVETERILEQKEKESRQIFYLVGSKEELQRAKVVRKKGGFLGVGGSIQLSDKLEDMFFQKGDYNIIKEISLGNTQNCNLVTTHPKGTYLFLKTPGEWYLKITNPQKFWSMSKYLVAEVD